MAERMVSLDADFVVWVGCAGLRIEAMSLQRLFVGGTVS
jgi:hypothetical protein